MFLVFLYEPGQIEIIDNIFLCQNRCFTKNSGNGYKTSLTFFLTTLNNLIRNWFSNFYHAEHNVYNMKRSQFRIFIIIYSTRLKCHCVPAILHFNLIGFVIILKGTSMFVIILPPYLQRRRLSF